jgi:glycine/D-amino acid oxidase-like deaminating enzyme
VKSSPIWQEGAPAALLPTSPFPAGATSSADVAVIGGGLTGLSAAYHLASARPGARIVLLEAGALGAGASGRNTGILGPGVGQSLPALVARLGRPAAAALYRATLEAVADVRALCAREAIDCDLQMTGQLLRARSRGDRRRLARQAALMAELELPFERLDDGAAAARLRLPAAAGSDADGPAALRFAHAGLLHPGKLVAALAARAAARGVSIYTDARVVALGGAGRVGARRASVAIAGGGTVLADDVVVATAGYTSGLGLLRGRVLPVHLQALATAPLPPESLAALSWSGRESVVEARRIFNYFRLTADDRLVFGGAAPRYHWRGRPPAEEGSRLARALRRELASVFPRAAGIDRLPVTHAWSGVIGYTLDALPVLGRDRDQPALVHALGWCGHGVALSVASGAWIARLVFESRALEGPWFRARSPLLPGEALRWLSFRTAVGAMTILDQVA